MLDRTLALISILAFAGFVGILIYYVTEPDLTIICVVVLAMAFFDFFLLTRGKSRTENDPADRS